MATAQEIRDANAQEAARRLHQRCWFTSADGRRCTTPRSGYHPTLCEYHAQREKEDEADLRFGGDLIYPGEELNTARAINTYLTRIAHMAATRRITPKLAGIMGYLGQLLLISAASIRKEDALAASAAAAAPPHISPEYLASLHERLVNFPPTEDSGFAPHTPSEPSPQDQGATAPIPVAETSESTAPPLGHAQQTLPSPAAAAAQTLHPAYSDQRSSAPPLIRHPIVHPAANPLPSPEELDNDPFLLDCLANMGQRLDQMQAQAAARKKPPPDSS